MPNVCILTDSTVQFTQSDFPGHDRVHVISFKLENIKQSQGNTLSNGVPVQKQLIPPSQQDFARLYASLSQTYDSILVLILSSLLSPAMQNAVSAAGQWPVQVIDSQTTSIGLGMLVQAAAEAASRGASLKEVDLQIRGSIPRVYMLFCLPELTYLAQTGQMDNAQALVAEMMGILPIFTFEEGRLVPIEKVRTPRHLFEAFQEFMDEFEAPSHIALIRSLARGSLGTSSLRQFVEETFPQTSFSEHILHPHLEALFGPRSLGLFLLDSN